MPACYPVVIIRCRCHRQWYKHAFGRCCHCTCSMRWFQKRRAMPPKLTNQARRCKRVLAHSRVPAGGAAAAGPAIGLDPALAPASYSLALATSRNERFRLPGVCIRRTYSFFGYSFGDIRRNVLSRERWRFHCNIPTVKYAYPSSSSRNDVVFTNSVLANNKSVAQRVHDIRRAAALSQVPSCSAVRVFRVDIDTKLLGQ